MSKSGSASHAMSDSDILESALPSGACRIPVPMTLASYRLKQMVTSASLEHVATDPKLEAASRNYHLVILRSAESLTADGLGRETRGIVSRLIFEFQFDARNSRNPSDNQLLSLTMRTYHIKEH